MEDIIIKPHHLLDILKLYGKGIEKFVPDINHEHDFYKIANMIVSKELWAHIKHQLPLINMKIYIKQ